MFQLRILVWQTCPYVARDGQFNPDARLVNDVGAFQDLSEAVFYNAIAWTFNTTKKSDYENDTGAPFLLCWAFALFLTSRTDSALYPNVVSG